LLEKGATLAGYRIERVLGAGGMGVVYEATQLSLNRTVALKVLAQELSSNPTFRKRFRREGQIQARLDHPHIVPVHEAGETDEGLFIAMRLVRGPTLKDLVVARELDPGRTLRILKQVASALDAAHEAGLIHRDVKPQNILVAGRDHPYLADFGLTQAEGSTHITATGQFVGTFDYISPEQIEVRELTPACDVYALTGVLFECLTGLVPFPKPGQAAVIYAHLAQAPPRVTDQRPELPGGLDAVIASGMAKLPEERPQSASRLIEAAEEAFDRRTRAAQSPPGPVESPAEVGVRGPESLVSTAEGPVPTKEIPRPPVAPTRQMPREPVPRERGRNPWILVGVLVAAAAAAALGAILGGSGDKKSAAAPTNANVASVGRLELSYPADLQRVDDGPSVRGLRLTDPVRIAPVRGPAGDGLLAGMSGATGPTLLPAAFVKTLAGGEPNAERVRVGKYEGYRYAGLRPRGRAGALTVYTVPTTNGVATIGCFGGPASAATFMPRCEEVAASLKLRDAEAVPVGPSEEYASALNRSLAPLTPAVSAAAKRARSERGRARRAAAIGAIGAAYEASRKSLAAVDAPPPVADVHRQLVTALGRTASAYASAATASRRGQRRRYARAARTAAQRAKELTAVLARLRARGYSVS
jgi:hypothetical protein